MRRRYKYLLIAVVLATAAGGVVAWRSRKTEPKDVWRTSKASQGAIVSIVNSTGTIEPVLKVSIGSFVSGPIIELLAEHNQHVDEGELLARVDPRLPASAVTRAQAALATREAEVHRAEALLEQSIRDERRAVALRLENADFISPKEMDAFHFNRLSLEAQLKLAESAVEQAEADLQNAEANLAYTEIRSPVEGIVIDRKISEGQTLAVSFQMPELFVVAPDMEKTMHVTASVDEADIGLIQQAKATGSKVTFRVDAYPEETFEGEIVQIRRSATTVQNVVTYPVVVATANPDLKLYPGMTANLSFEVGRREDVVRLPNSALRFYPAEKNDVREEDRKLLEGAFDEGDAEDSRSYFEIVEAKRNDRKRHVWVVEGEKLRAIEVETGLYDGRYSEMVKGDVTEGMELVTGRKNETTP
ncbi:MAG: efflux RND transporter periplasmic adaptor subunit [Planctomycetales bacterium]|nr:efflux RND transporter periplasmic adaptor subunit [Planctomycetales bacterium]